MVLQTQRHPLPPVRRAPCVREERHPDVQRAWTTGTCAHPLCLIGGDRTASTQHGIQAHASQSTLSHVCKTRSSTNFPQPTTLSHVRERNKNVKTVAKVRTEGGKQGQTEVRRTKEVTKKVGLGRAMKKKESNPKLKRQLPLPQRTVDLCQATCCTDVLQITHTDCSESLESSQRKSKTVSLQGKCYKTRPKTNSSHMLLTGCTAHALHQFANVPTYAMFMSSVYPRAACLKPCPRAEGMSTRMEAKLVQLLEVRSCGEFGNLGATAHQKRISTQRTNVQVFS